jgi:hypothetical protein
MNTIPGKADGAIVFQPVDAQSSEPGNRRRLRAAGFVIGSFILGLMMTTAVLWATAGIVSGAAISGTPLVAALLGGGGAMAIGAVLMKAVFYSDRSGWDQNVR